jgi:hypothetical protein
MHGCVVRGIRSITRSGVTSKQSYEPALTVCNEGPRVSASGERAWMLVMKEKGTPTRLLWEKLLLRQSRDGLEECDDADEIRTG